MLENLQPKEVFEYLNCAKNDLTFDLMEFKKDWICLDTTLEEEKVSKAMLKFLFIPSFYFAIIACSISLIDWFLYSFILL